MNEVLDIEVVESAGRGSRGRWRLLPVVAGLMLSITMIGADSASAAEPSVPFKASVAGTLAPTSATTFELAGSGLASHLGDLQSYDASVTITGVDPATGVITDTLVETLTAANGDTITILCQQTATPVSPGVYVGSDEWTVIGGTGRFGGATGSGDGETHVDLNLGTFTKDLAGSITY